MGAFIVTARDEASRTLVCEHKPAAAGEREHPVSVAAAQLKFASPRMFEALPVGAELLVSVEPLL